jgi:hypothetical protein
MGLVSMGRESYQMEMKDFIRELRKFASGRMKIRLVLTVLTGHHFQ